MAVTPEAHNREAHRLRYLDGLRGWAALVVVFFHATWELFKGYQPAVRTSAAGFLNDGKLAVFVFFVLSGLVLAYPYLSTMRIQVITKLALRRYVRLLIPIAAASFVAFVMHRANLLYHREADLYVHSENWLGTFYPFTANFWGWLRFALYDVFFNYKTETSYDIVLWTMPYELAGSFLVFGLLAISGQSLAARIVGYVAAAFLCRAEAPYLLGFVFGAALAEAMLSPFWSLAVTRWGDVVGSMLIGLSFGGSIFLRSHYSPQKCAFVAGAVVTGVLISGFWRRLLETPLSQWLGRISFPLYLTHTLVLFGPGSALLLWLAGRGVTGWPLVTAVAAFIVGLSLVVATVFYPVELLAIRGSHAFSRAVLEAPKLRDRWLQRRHPRPPTIS